MADWDFWGLVVTIVMVIFLLKRFGFFDYLMNRLIQYLMKSLGQRVGLQGIGTLIGTLTQTLTEPGIKIFDTYAAILYTYNGEERAVYLPYTRRFHPKYIDVEVFLRKEDKLIDITQQPGIPYMINAEKLGGKEIVLRGNNKEIILDAKTIPTMTHMDDLFISSEISAAAQ